MAEKMADSIVDALKENGVADGRVGIDIMDFRAYESLKAKGVKLVNAWPAMSGARTIKTPDEIECLKIAAAHGDAAMWRAMKEWSKPGVREAEITAKVNEYLYSSGFDVVYEIICASVEHDSLPPLAHRQDLPPGRSRHRRHQRRRAGRLLHRLRANVEGRCQAYAEGKGSLQGMLRLHVRGDW